MVRLISFERVARKEQRTRRDKQQPRRDTIEAWMGSMVTPSWPRSRGRCGRPCRRLGDGRRGGRHRGPCRRLWTCWACRDWHPDRGILRGGGVMKPGERRKERRPQRWHNRHFISNATQPRDGSQTMLASLTRLLASPGAGPRMVGNETESLACLFPAFRRKK